MLEMVNRISYRQKGTNLIYRFCGRIFARARKNLFVCTHLFADSYMWNDRSTYMSRSTHIIWNDRPILYETIEIWGGLQKYLFMFAEIYSILSIKSSMEQ